MPFSSRILGSIGPIFSICSGCLLSSARHGFRLSAFGLGIFSTLNSCKNSLQRLSGLNPDRLREGQHAVRRPAINGPPAQRDRRAAF